MFYRKNVTWPYNYLNGEFCFDKNFLNTLERGWLVVRYMVADTNCVLQDEMDDAGRNDRPLKGCGYSP